MSRQRRQHQAPQGASLAVDCLDGSPHAGNTIVVLFSDHGWHLGEKQAWGKQSGWIHSTQVPLIICGPGTQTNVICDEPVSLLDLYPTLVELAGLKSRNLDGVSLAALLKNPMRDTGRVVKTYINSEDYVLSGQRWRYIRYGAGGEELYDIQSDPGEYRNLSGNHSQQKTIDQLHDRVHKGPTGISESAYTGRFITLFQLINCHACVSK